MIQLELFAVGPDLSTTPTPRSHPASEVEVIGWLVARGYRVTRGATTTAPDDEEPRRLSRQCRKILALLQERGNRGVWNTELVTIAIKYTGRISEIRGHGHNIAIVERDGGRRRYVLVVPS